MTVQSTTPDINY